MHGTERLGRMMYEELAGDLRYCYKGDCNGCRRYTKDTRFCYDLLRDAADAIEELNGFLCEAERDRDEYRERLDKTNDILLNRWIPVTERMPEMHDEVLICNEDYGKTDLGFATVALWDGSDWINAWNRAGTLHYVTHWMPIPEPPKEEA